MIVICLVGLWAALGYVEGSAGQRPVGRFAWLARLIASCICAAIMAGFGIAHVMSTPIDWLGLGFSCFVFIVSICSVISDFRRRKEIERLLAEGKIDSIIGGG